MLTCGSALQSLKLLLGLQVSGVYGQNRAQLLQGLIGLTQTQISP